MPPQCHHDTWDYGVMSPTRMGRCPPRVSSTLYGSAPGTIHPNGACGMGQAQICRALVTSVSSATAGWQQGQLYLSSSPLATCAASTMSLSEILFPILTTWRFLTQDSSSIRPGIFPTLGMFTPAVLQERKQCASGLTLLCSNTWPGAPKEAKSADSAHRAAA